MDFYMDIHRCTFVCIILIGMMSRLSTCINCTGIEDGLYEVSCQSATWCKNGTISHVSCVQPLVMDEEARECVHYLTAKNPCGNFRDCSFRDDGSYPDLEFQCRWYYICRYEILFGHSKCASDLVWNTELQTCDFKQNVEPPCGTKTSA